MKIIRLNGDTLQRVTWLRADNAGLRAQIAANDRAMWKTIRLAHRAATKGHSCQLEASGFADSQVVVKVYDQTEHGDSDIPHWPV